MAEQNSKNSLRYTGLSYEDIKSQVEASLAGDSRFDNFVDSALYKIILNTFAGTTDMTNYYLERQAEEMYLDTAQHLSSVILAANQIGYVVTRPTPASANLNIVLKGPLTLTEGDILTVGFKDPLVFNGNPYILKYTYQYTFTADDASNAISDTWIKSFNKAIISNTTESANIEMIQGEEALWQIYPESQAGQKWQKYNIEDPFFSNLYGEEDLGEGELDNYRNVSSVFITDKDADVGTGNEFHINRRSLTADDYTVDAIRENIQNGEDDNSSIRACLIKTQKDTTVDLFFGDDISTALGPNSGQRIDVTYFSTVGSQANETGIIGNKVTWNGTAEIDGTNVNENISFYLTTNIRSGADIEEKDSIKLNAPGVFQAGDRLVTRNDYKYYLKSITSPVQIHHSVAWGEADEARAQNVNAIIQLFNAIILSGMGSMYSLVSNSTTTTAYEPKKILYKTSNYMDDDDIDTTFIEGSDNIGSYSEQSYFDLYIKNDTLDYLNYIYFDTSAPSGVIEFLGNINGKSQATVKNFYVSPIVQGFDLTGNVYIKSFTDTTKIKDYINASIFEWLKGNNDFEQPIYISQIIDIIKNYSEIDYCDIAFEPIDVDDGYKLTDVTTDVVSSSADYSIANLSILTTAATDALYNYMPYSVSSAPSSALDINTSASISYSTSDGSDIQTYLSETGRISGYNERTFYDSFAKIYYEDVKDVQRISDSAYYVDTNDFKDFISKANSSFKLSFRNGMLDEKGNIVNFSFPMEIAHVFADNLKYNYSS